MSREIESEDEDEILELIEETKRDALGEIREGDVETNLGVPYSRHYEARSVAVRYEDSWIGWTYWYGGGKWGEPETIDWISQAYELKVVRTRTIEVYDFEKV